MATNGAANGAANGPALAHPNGNLEQDPRKGTPIHAFDPNASPAQKGAAAGKGSDKLKSVNDQPGAGEREVFLDTAKSNIVPTITVEDHDAAQPKQFVQQPTAPGETKAPVADDNTPNPPGAMPLGPAPTIPDWYRVGWREVSGIDNPVAEEGEEKDKNILHLFLAEQFYGTWYHNAAVIIFAVFVSHFLARFNFGWGWLFILLAGCNTYYSTSMERVRQRSRDDIQRELVKTRLMSEHESAEWINNFLDRFWLIYEPVLSKTIISSVDQVLSTNTPAFLDSLRLTEFTLGTKAPHIDKVRTFPKTPDDIIMMDWGLSFTPNDISDITPRQALSKTNPKIVLSVRVGKGLATAAMPILLEDITFSGLMRIRLKLMTNFPHVQVVDICFLEKPVIDYVLKPIGGETFGFDIANIPGLSSFIRDMTHATLGPMMYDPNVFTLNLEQLLSGAPIDTTIGVLQVTIQSARGLKGAKLGGGVPDPYVSLSIENRAELARTKYKHNTYNPTWMETKFLLIRSLSETLILSLFDFNDHRKNTMLSAASFELASLADDAKQEGIVVPLLKDGKERGELKFDLSYYPVLKAEEGEEIADTSVGVVRLVVHQAKELDVSKSLARDLNPLAKIFLGDHLLHTTPRFKHTVNPVWEEAHEFLCADKASSVITVKVIDDRDIFKDPVIGYMSIRLQDLLDAKAEGKEWWPLSNCKSGKLRLSAEWKPLNMAGSLHGADSYKPPIGVVRLWLDKATEVKNVEATLGGKSDPYMRVQVNNVTKGRTEVVNNNLNPTWDQIIYIPVHSLKETLFLECMDYQHLTKDRSLGSVELAVSELARPSEDQRYPFESTGVKKATDPIKLDKGSGYKGQLHYTAEFVPALALRGIEFKGEENELQRAAEGEEDPDGGIVDSGSSSSSSDDNEDVPVGVTINTGERKGHTKGAKSTDTTATTNTTNSKRKAESVHTTGSVHTAGSMHTANSAHTADDARPGVDISREELLAQQSGIIVFNVIGGTLEKKARLEVLLDDGYWPAFSTIKARSTRAEWQYVGEGFIKELDFGRVWLRLNEAEDDQKDDIIAEWKGNAKMFLESTLDKPCFFTLTDESEREKSTIEIEARYVPVPVKLDPRESINNQGTLFVELLDGREIHGIDRGGKSDPFAVFSLNGQKVFKSQTKKKTVAPDWHEKFPVQVPSRVGADFSVEIFDWNQIEQAKSLGNAKIELADLEPFQAVERSLNLVSTKHGEKGTVRVRLMFQPEIIAKSRKNTSTFSAAGRAMTHIGGLPVGAGKGVVHGVAGIFHKGHGGKDEELPPVPDLPAGQASVAVAPNAAPASFPTRRSTPSVDGAPAPGEPGTLRVTVLDAKDLGGGDAKPYVTLRIGDKEWKTKHVGKTAQPAWNEGTAFAAGAFTPTLYVWVHDHKTIGKDRSLGDAEIDIWRHVQTEGVSAAEVTVELREGTGKLRLRLEYDADSSGAASVHSADRSPLLAHRTMSIASPSRFSLSKRRHAEQADGSD